MKAMITYDIIVLIVNFLHPSTQRRDILRIRTSMSTYCDIQLRTPINVKRHIREIHARKVIYIYSHCEKECMVASGWGANVFHH